MTRVRHALPSGTTCLVRDTYGLAVEPNEDALALAIAVAIDAMEKDEV
jgi:uncharacterized protein YxjI